MESSESRKRVVIEGVDPEIDGGRFAIKRCLGEKVIVQADIFSDSHDLLSARLRYRGQGDKHWHQTDMQMVINDRWRGEFAVSQFGRYHYSLIAWVDAFKTFRRDLHKKVQAGQDIAVELTTGAALIRAAAARAVGPDADRLVRWAADLQSELSLEIRVATVSDPVLAAVMDRYADLEFATVYGKELEVVVDPPHAGFSAWYELFPRSCGTEEGGHGTLRDCEARLGYIAEMGFDVVYLPPIHPIGEVHRKGRNNSPQASPDDPGSPWAIGSAQGGHKSIHPRLGTLEDFRRLVQKAAELNIRIALDIAFQCAPDHPYTREHPEWFRWRPDGRIQYAENPPKKYEDIYPLNFETEHWRELWEELKSIFIFWIEQGVRIFRVDNPHTKPFAFWEWVIAQIKRDHPDTVFLSEAFTRPKVMYRLAKSGFTQSYTYFTWRNAKWELTQYFNQLYHSSLVDFFRPNLWPNTPDILPEYLQAGGRPAFMVRLVLAATLGANYGIYGPAFELQENRPREAGSEEYLDSEKYQIRRWEWGRADSLKTFISRINQIRRQNPAFSENRSLVFHPIDSDELLCFSKRTGDLENIILVIVNLDPYHTRSGWLELPIAELGLDAQQTYQMHDLLSGARFIWHGATNYIELDPHVVPAHIFRLRRWIRSEKDFDYFM
jgi:starch synthase (maltosyl-transferring)